MDSLAKIKHEVIREARFINDAAKAVGSSKRLSYSVLQEMADSERMFAESGIRIPLYVTKSEIIYFSKLKPHVQTLMIQKMNTTRYHADAESRMYAMKTKLTHNSLSQETLDEVLGLVETLPVIFDLDANNYPVTAVMDNCPVEMFLKARLDYIFVEDMEEFWATPVPRASKGRFGLKADSQDLSKNICSKNILLAY